MEIQRFAKNYLRCIRDVDENIGRIRSIYEKLVSRECIMVYTAHQGRFIGENGWFGTQWMMEPSMRTPLVFALLMGKRSRKKNRFKCAGHRYSTYNFKFGIA